MLKIRKSRQIACKNFLTAKQKSNEKYNKNAIIVHYKIGDLVHIVNNRPRKNKKMFYLCHCKT